jgi:hypothetical protein
MFNVSQISKFIFSLLLLLNFGLSQVSLYAAPSKNPTKLNQVEFDEIVNDSKKSLNNKKLEAKISKRLNQLGGKDKSAKIMQESPQNFDKLNKEDQEVYLLSYIPTSSEQLLTMDSPNLSKRGEIKSERNAGCQNWTGSYMVKNSYGYLLFTYSHRIYVCGNNTMVTTGQFVNTFASSLSTGVSYYGDVNNSWQAGGPGYVEYVSWRQGIFKSCVAAYCFYEYRPWIEMHGTKTGSAFQYNGGI